MPGGGTNKARVLCSEEGRASHDPKRSIWKWFLIESAFDALCMDHKEIWRRIGSLGATLGHLGSPLPPLSADFWPLLAPFGASLSSKVATEERS